MQFLDIGRQTDIYGDGIHDDTKAIQRCLDTLREGGTIWFPNENTQRVWICPLRIFLIIEFSVNLKVSYVCPAQ